MANATILLLLGLLLVHHPSLTRGQLRDCNTPCGTVDDKRVLSGITNQGDDTCMVYDSNLPSATQMAAVAGVKSAGLCLNHCMKKNKGLAVDKPSCTGFTFTAATSACSLKQGTLGNFVDANGMTSGFHNCRTSCGQPRVGYTALTGGAAAQFDILGAAVPGVASEQQAQMECAVTDGCKYFTWSPSARTSQNWQGTGTAAQIAATGSVAAGTAAVSGTRACAPSCFIRNVDFNGALLVRIRTNGGGPKLCQDLCNANSRATCKMFVYHYAWQNPCWLHTAVGTYKQPGTDTAAGPACCCNP